MTVQVRLIRYKPNTFYCISLTQDKFLYPEIHWFTSCWNSTKHYAAKRWKTCHICMHIDSSSIRYVSRSRVL